MKFEVYRGKNKKWYWRLRSKGKIVADGGQGYSASQNARRAVISLKKQLKGKDVPIETVEK
jgi:uncharacterized protein YegP (UPF0339 family)